MFYVSKTFTHELGLSVAFRQWKSESHCRFLHGYALEITVTFRAESLDDRNWVVDFGGMASLKSKLVSMFDHKTIVSRDDPCIEWFISARNAGIADVVVVDAVGCEMFALMVFSTASDFLKEIGSPIGVAVDSSEVREHGANCAKFSI